jgi:hypothetical protein
VSRLIALFALLCGCSVPTLSEVIGARALACDDAGACLPDYVCLEFCQPVTGAPCEQVGQVVACGRTTGECAQGTIRCDGQRFGSCVGAIPPMPEICGNGKDDDCDGKVDQLSDGGACP